MQYIITYSTAWNEILDTLSNIEQKIQQMSFENDIIYPNTKQYTGDLITEHLKEIEELFLELI